MVETCSLALGFLFGSAHGNEESLPRVRSLSKSSSHVVAGHSGHSDVLHDCIGAPFPGDLNGRSPGVCAPHFVAIHEEKHGQAVRGIFIVIDDKDVKSPGWRNVTVLRRTILRPAWRAFRLQVR
jgi:hypothetical protein